MDYYKLDEKDIVIIQVLAKDSRTKLSTLAEELNTSIPTIRSRIDKLEALGIIQQFSLILSYELLSEHPIYFITIKTTPNSVNYIIETFNSHQKVLEIHELIGSFQILLKTVPLSMPDFQALMQSLRTKEGILEINSMPISTTFKHETARLPAQDIQVKIRCEYCGKQIEKDYQTLTTNDVTHFFCCTSCLRNYEKENSAIEE
jgi:DNA-binding Lrp family transcriptional regulator